MQPVPAEPDESGSEFMDISSESTTQQLTAPSSADAESNATLQQYWFHPPLVIQPEIDIHRIDWCSWTRYFFKLSSVFSEGGV